MFADGRLHDILIEASSNFFVDFILCPCSWLCYRFPSFLYSLDIAGVK
ncbi:hypothetical protein KNP414_05335 [Paenibacillus mucilaginosus KNP414]|uniref:Uncharacterized protein n=1 Tax=Paenibacillus mucilaginosus (strain KNP414) TaxID=1036673 RepID=F8FEA0_PAEMK|nr:hypothetical protein KNP414_05335 [Paenibacillus mucilaginosus KNP414]